MKKLTNTLYCYLVLLFCSVIFYQCCNGEMRILGSGDMGVRDQITFRNDTISNEFTITNALEREIVRHQENGSFISSAWATSCDYPYVNPINEASMSISFSKDIVYNNSTISSGTNIYGLASQDIIYSPFQGILEFFFQSSFIDKSNIPDGDYEILFSAETSDGLMIENKVTTYFQID